MRKLLLALSFLLLIPCATWAQSVPIPEQGSTAYEASHIFSGIKLYALCVSWNTANVARWLMVFDSTTVPVDGSVTPKWCQPVSGSTTPASSSPLCFDWTSHPLWNRNGVVVVLSSNASGCTTKTLDGTTDWFNAQVSD